MRGKFAGLGVAGLVLALAACSASIPRAAPSHSPKALPEPSPIPAPRPDPCKLLGAADISAAFGGTVGAPVASSFFGNPMCAYTIRGSRVGTDVDLQILIPLQFTGNQFAAGEAATPTTTAIAGVGDAAYYNTKTYGLILAKGTSYIEIVAKLPDGFTPDASRLQAAVIAVGRVAGSAGP